MNPRHFASLAVSAAFVVLAFGSAEPPPDGQGRNAVGEAPSPIPSAPAAPRTADIVVDAATLIAAYESNEVAADMKYKGKVLQVSGKVGDIKKDILDNIYVTLGTGKQFELRQVQAFFDDADAGRAATLSKGQRITVIGQCDGLMMNVVVKDSTFVE
jgi:hypothetical protein